MYYCSTPNIEIIFFCLYKFGVRNLEDINAMLSRQGMFLIGVDLEQAIIVSCCGCFHGRTLAVISMSCDNDATRGFGPLLPGHLKVDFGDSDALENIFKGQYILSFML